MFQKTCFVALVYLYPLIPIDSPLKELVIYTEVDKKQAKAIYMLDFFVLICYYPLVLRVL